MHRTMFLSHKGSMESFVSPTALLVESPSPSGGRRRRIESTSSSGGLRRLKSLSQLQVRKDPLPHIPELCVTRSTFVNVRQKGLARLMWTRQYLRMTKHTLSLHQNENSPALDIIVLRRVLHIGRVNIKSHCLRIKPSDGTRLYLAFDDERELYDWLTDIHSAISSVGRPTDIQHLNHVETDKNDKTRFIGVPEEWLQLPLFSHRESSIGEMILPQIPLVSKDDLILGLDPSTLFSRPVSPESFIDTDEEDDAIVQTAQLAIKPTTQRLLAMNSGKQPPRLTIEGISALPSSDTTLQSSLEKSPSTPLLTPDTSPMTPFRESPYSYRETDAQDLSGRIHRQGEWPDACGGFADIWRAQWHIEPGVAYPVAVKVLRVLSQDEAIQKKIQKRLRNEVRVWHQLRHTNVVQLLGTCDGFSPFISMVSRWYENGNVNTYLLKLGDAGTIERRLKLLKEVATGLTYLHSFSFPVVHGDVKGANILVNDQGEAALADFGLSSILQVAGVSGTSTFSGGSVRWMAPELLKMNLPPYSARQKTCASDTYSYGSVILEIMTGDKPYKNISNDIQVINHLMQGWTPKRPSKPLINPAVWELMEWCWMTEVCERPSMALVLYRMERFYAERRESMLPEEMLGYAL